jgi:hypothetical protein
LQCRSFPCFFFFFFFFESFDFLCLPDRERDRELEVADDDRELEDDEDDDDDDDEDDDEEDRELRPRRSRPLLDLLLLRRDDLLALRLLDGPLGDGDLLPLLPRPRLRYLLLFFFSSSPWALLISLGSFFRLASSAA